MGPVWPMWDTNGKDVRKICKGLFTLVYRGCRLVHVFREKENIATMSIFSKPEEVTLREYEMELSGTMINAILISCF